MLCECSGYCLCVGDLVVVRGFCESSLYLFYCVLYHAGPWVQIMMLSWPVD